MADAQGCNRHTGMTRRPRICVKDLIVKRKITEYAYYFMDLSLAALTNTERSRDRPPPRKCR
jgi:hypothetical protein